MPLHFGVNLRETKKGLNLTRDNYITINTKSSFSNGRTYSDEWCKKYYIYCLENFDLNMRYFSSLNYQEFTEKLNEFVEKFNFTQIFSLSEHSLVSGYYILVLDKYKQIYIGTTKKIKERILGHWSKTKPFDRLVFGRKENSIISIDSFRAFDTTRIFVHVTENIFNEENNYIECFDSKFLLNRTVGGFLQGGLEEAIAKGKTRNLITKSN